jgi:hypothetical protein
MPKSKGCAEYLISISLPMCRCVPWLAVEPSDVTLLPTEPTVELTMKPVDSSS